MNFRETKKLKIGDKVVSKSDNSILTIIGITIIPPIKNVYIYTDSYEHGDWLIDHVDVKSIDKSIKV